MTSWREADVETNGIRLHITRTGGDKPALVLAHGITDDGLCWTPIAQALAADYDVIMVDARGHGRSEAPAHGFDPRTQADDLYGLISAMRLDRPIVMGHSMGAMTTLLLAGMYPGAARAIVLEDPPGWWITSPDGARSAADQASMRAWMTSVKQKSREQLVAEQRAATPGWSDAEIEPWADSKLRFSLNILDIFNPQPGPPIDWTAIVSAIRCPALLITADVARGAALNDEAATALQALVPHLEIVHIEGAGHNIRRDQYDRFMTIVRDFLERQNRTAESTGA